MLQNQNICEFGRTFLVPFGFRKTQEEIEAVVSPEHRFTPTAPCRVLYADMTLLLTCSNPVHLRHLHRQTPRTWARDMSLSVDGQDRPRTTAMSRTRTSSRTWMLISREAARPAAGRKARKRALRRLAWSTVDHASPRCGTRGSRWDDERASAETSNDPYDLFPVPFRFTNSGLVVEEQKGHP